MRRVPIPRDVNKIKVKVMLNMTKRQLVCFSIGGAIGIPIFFLTKDALGVSGAVMLMMTVMLPAFFFAMYEKHDQPCEVLLRNYFQAVFLQPKFRPNQAVNLYTYLEVQNELEMEVNRIVQQDKKRQETAKLPKGTK